MDILIDPLFSDLNNNKVPVIPDNIFKRKNPEKYTQKFLQALIEASLQDVLQCFFFIFERFKIKQFCLIITRSIYGGAYSSAEAKDPNNFEQQTAFLRCWYC